MLDCGPNPPFVTFCMCRTLYLMTVWLGAEYTRPFFSMGARRASRAALPRELFRCDRTLLSASAPCRIMRSTSAKGRGLPLRRRARGWARLASGLLP